MSIRPQIELNRTNRKTLEGLKKKIRLPLSLTELSNEAIAVGLPAMIRNLTKAGVINGKK